jgi:hypothetical protein
MKRDDHYLAAQELLDCYGTSPLQQGRAYDHDIPDLLRALTHAVLASVDSDVADPIPWT